LTPEERAQLLPSGKQAIIANRAHWAKFYLTKAGLISMTRRAHFTIIQRGRELLAKNPTRIDNSVLLKYPEFVEFLTKGRDATSQPPAAAMIAARRRVARSWAISCVCCRRQATKPDVSSKLESCALSNFVRGR
jgi:restriction system protein